MISRLFIITNIRQFYTNYCNNIYMDIILSGVIGTSLGTASYLGASYIIKFDNSRTIKYDKK